MPDEAVVINTGPIIALSILGMSDILKKFYQPVYVSLAVENEIRYGGYNAPGYKEINADWLIKYRLNMPMPLLLSMELDMGEAETIASALELGIKKVIIDESMGRQIATYLGLRPTGTVGILLRAKKENHIHSVRPLLDKLMKRGFRLSRNIYNWSITEAKE